MGNNTNKSNFCRIDKALSNLKYNLNDEHTLISFTSNAINEILVYRLSQASSLSIYNEEALFVESPNNINQNLYGQAITEMLDKNIERNDLRDVTQILNKKSETILETYEAFNNQNNSFNVVHNSEVGSLSTIGNLPSRPDSANEFNLTSWSTTIKGKEKFAGVELPTGEKISYMAPTRQVNAIKIGRKEEFTLSGSKEKNRNNNTIKSEKISSNGNFSINNNNVTNIQKVNQNNATINSGKTIVIPKSLTYKKKAMSPQQKISFIGSIGSSKTINSMGSPFQPQPQPQAQPQAQPQSQPQPQPQVHQEKKIPVGKKLNSFHVEKPFPKKAMSPPLIGRPFKEKKSLGSIHIQHNKNFSPPQSVHTANNKPGNTSVNYAGIQINLPTNTTSGGSYAKRMKEKLLKEKNKSNTSFDGAKNKSPKRKEEKVIPKEKETKTHSQIPSMKGSFVNNTPIEDNNMNLKPVLCPPVVAKKEARKEEKVEKKPKKKKNPKMVFELDLSDDGEDNGGNEGNDDLYHYQETEPDYSTPKLKKDEDFFFVPKEKAKQTKPKETSGRNLTMNTYEDNDTFDSNDLNLYKKYLEESVDNKIEQKKKELEKKIKEEAILESSFDKKYNATKSKSKEKSKKEVYRNKEKLTKLYQLKNKQNQATEKKESNESQKSKRREKEKEEEEEIYTPAYLKTEVSDDTRETRFQSSSLNKIYTSFKSKSPERYKLPLDLDNYLVPGGEENLDVIPEETGRLSKDAQDSSSCFSFTKPHLNDSASTNDKNTLNTKETNQSSKKFNFKITTKINEEEFNEVGFLN